MIAQFMQILEVFVVMDIKWNVNMCHRKNSGEQISCTKKIRKIFHRKIKSSLKHNRS